MMEDEEDGFLDDPSERERFKRARNGDNYLCPFQCDLCQFRNTFSAIFHAFAHEMLLRVL